MAYGFHSDRGFSLPSGAEIVWNPYIRDRVTDAGLFNSFTVGGTYTRLMDLSGHGFHATKVTGTDPDATDADYLGIEGATALPVVQAVGGKQLGFTAGAPYELGLFSIVYAGHTANSLSNGYAEYLNTGPCNLSPEWVNAGYRQMVDPNSTAFGPQWTCPAGDPADTTSWRAYVIVCGGAAFGPNATLDWRVLHVERYNGAISVYANLSFSESQSANNTGTNYTRRTQQDGLKLWGSHDAGMLARWLRPFSEDEIVPALLAAVEQVAPDDVAEVATLLGYSTAATDIYAAPQNNAAFRLRVFLGGQTEDYYVDGEVVEQLDFFESTPSARTFTCAVDLRFFDLPLLLSDGITPDAAVCQVWRDDELVLVGKVQDPRWSSHGPTRLKIVEEPWIHPVPWPPPYQFRFEAADTFTSAYFDVAYAAEQAGINDPIIVDTEAPVYVPPALVNALTHAAYSESAEGRVYPWVIGKPGVLAANAGSSVTSPWPAAPALWVNTGTGAERLLAAIGRVKATTCTLFGYDNNGDFTSFSSVPLGYTTDAQGRIITTVVAVTPFNTGGIPTGTDLKPDVEAEYWVSYDDYGNVPGNLGDVMLWVLGQTQTRKDRERLLAYLPKLRRFKMDGYIDEECDLIEWLLSTIEPFPVRLVTGRKGTFVWVYDPEEEPVVHIEVGQDAHPDGDLRLTSREPVRQYEISYCHDDKERTLQSVSTARSLHSEHGRITGGAVKRISSLYIQDPATADACARLRVRALGQRHLVVSLVARWDRLGHLTVGDPVRLTHANEGLTAKRGVVTRIADTAAETFSLEVTVYMDPATWRDEG